MAQARVCQEPVDLHDLKLGLEHPTKAEDEGRGLAFDFLADPAEGSIGPSVLTGHDNGLIT